MKKSLHCGCCGISFRGTQSADHDYGYGLCAKCTFEQDQKADQMMSSIIGKLVDSLSPANQAFFKTLSQEEQEQLAIRTIDEGLLSWTA
ncbi:hypothetical protein G6Z92_06135 [Vibrio aestuarianus subsp. cardii]|uniref:hypothetical protein n=1 Tax=Vibrio aestuarianus TaxID=28171 RepID=UPI0015C5465F|nr:hypothetical protein [Vibrio aestuarianus]NGZ66564.1 hypothetical protein [Vibrio aestuarianus subsp. cardii]